MASTLIMAAKELAKLTESLCDNGDTMADDLSIRQHTQGLKSKTLDALDKWDPSCFEARRLIKAVIELAEREIVPL
jgi:hypothetical protein